MIYVPAVTIGGSAQDKRWQVSLLGDVAMTPAQAAAQPLDSLPLSAPPWLDLGSVAYVDRTTGEVGLNPRQSASRALRSRLSVGEQGVPFVITADDAPVYLGAFVTLTESGRLIWSCLEGPNEPGPLMH